MRIKTGPVIVGFLALLVIVLALTGSFKGRQDDSEGATKPSPATPNSPAPELNRSETHNTELPKRVRSFLRAYYQLEPDDTTESRRARVAPFVPQKDQQKFLAGLGLLVNTTTEADRARTNGGWVQRAKRIHVLQARQSSYEPTIIVVGASLEVSVTRPKDKKDSPGIPTRVASLWEKQAGKWVLRSFKEGGDIE